MIIELLIVFLLAMCGLMFFICFSKAVRIVEKIDVIEDVQKETAKQCIKFMDERLNEKGSSFNYVDVFNVMDAIINEYGLH